MSRYTIAIFILLFISSSRNIQAQSYCANKYDYTWLIGGIDLDTIEDEYGGGEINFNFMPPMVKAHPKPVRMPFQNLSISSVEGELAFYSNGCIVLNKLDMQMDNGDTLSPGEGHDWFCPLYGYRGLQSMLSIPNAYDSTLYFVFYISQVFPHDTNASSPVFSENLYYAIIDISLNNGLGKVVTKNEILFKDTSMMGTPLTAVKHANGVDWWITTPNRWSNDFHMVYLGSEGPQYLGKQQVGIPPHPGAEAGQGKFSPDGLKFAWFHPRNGLFLYDFDRDFGILSSFQQISIPVSDFVAGGCEFSPSGRFVYVNNDYDLYQVDTWSEDIQQSVTHIDTYDGFGDPLPTRFFCMERTPDNRIFMNVVNGSQYLHVIQEPNRKGKDCGFEQHALKLPTVNNFTLPHFPNYRLGAVEDSLCDDFISGEAIIEENNKYSIYPNPAFSYVEIKGVNTIYSDNIVITLLDVMGNVIGYYNSPNINLNDIPSGLYFCLIREKNKIIQIEKLVIQH